MFLIALKVGPWQATPASSNRF